MLDTTHLRALRAAGTQGEWHVDQPADDDQRPGAVVFGGREDFGEDLPLALHVGDANAALIAAAVNAIDPACDELDRLRAELASVRAERDAVTLAHAALAKQVRMAFVAGADWRTPDATRHVDHEHAREEAERRFPDAPWPSTIAVWSDNAALRARVEELEAKVAAASAYVDLMESPEIQGSLAFAAHRAVGLVGMEQAQKADAIRTAAKAALRGSKP